MILNRLFLLLHCVCFSQISFSQSLRTAPTPYTGLPFVKLTGKVEILDSNYLFKPNLVITKKNEQIKIHKLTVFHSNRVCKPSDGALFLQKKVRGIYMNISMNYTSQPISEADLYLYKSFKENDFLTDTINLAFKYPLEVGEYSLQYFMEYLYKGKKYLAISEDINFSVSFLPKNSFW